MRLPWQKTREQKVASLRAKLRTLQGTIPVGSEREKHLKKIEQVKQQLRDLGETL